MFKWLEKYFTFSRTERNAIVALLTLSFLVLIAPRVYYYFKPVQHADNSKYQKEIDAFVNGNKNLTGEDLTDTATATKDSLGIGKDSAAIKKPRLSTGLCIKLYAKLSLLCLPKSLTGLQFSGLKKLVKHR